MHIKSIMIILYNLVHRHVPLVTITLSSPPLPPRPPSPPRPLIYDGTIKRSKRAGKEVTR